VWLLLFIEGLSYIAVEVCSVVNKRNSCIAVTILLQTVLVNNTVKSN